MDALWQGYGAAMNRLLASIPTWMRVSPNNITLMRVAFVPVFLFFVPALTSWERLLAATVVFVVTDLLDGACARAWNMVSVFGKHLDPLADKIVLFFFLVYLVLAQVIPMGLFFLIMFIEAAIVVIAAYWIYDRWTVLPDPRSLQTLLEHLDQKSSVQPAGKIKIAMYCLALLTVAVAGMIDSFWLAAAGVGFAFLGILFAVLSIPRYLNPPPKP